MVTEGCNPRPLKALAPADAGGTARLSIDAVEYKIWQKTWRKIYYVAKMVPGRVNANFTLYQSHKTV